MQPCSNVGLIFWWRPLNRPLYCLGLGANQIKYMDILGVTFDVDGWFNSGNALHALLIYHDLTHEKIYSNWQNIWTVLWNQYQSFLPMRLFSLNSSLLVIHIYTFQRKSSTCIYTWILQIDMIFFTKWYPNHIKVLHSYLNWSSKCFLDCCVKTRGRIVSFLDYACKCCRTVNTSAAKHHTVTFIFSRDVSSYGKYQFILGIHYDKRTIPEMLAKPAC